MTRENKVNIHIFFNESIHSHAMFYIDDECIASKKVKFKHDDDNNDIEKGT